MAPQEADLPKADPKEVAELKHYLEVNSQKFLGVSAGKKGKKIPKKVIQEKLNEAKRLGIEKVNVRISNSASKEMSIEELAGHSGLKIKGLDDLSKAFQTKPSNKKLESLFSKIEILQKNGESKQEIQKIMQDLDKVKNFEKIVKKNKGLNQSRNKIIINLYGGSNETSGMSSILKTINSPKMQSFFEGKNITGENAAGQTVNHADLNIEGNGEKLNTYNMTLQNMKGKEYAPYFDLVRELVGEGKFIPKVSDNLRGFVEGFIKHSGNKERRNAFNQAWPTGDKASPAQWDKVNELILENHNELSS